MLTKIKTILFATCAGLVPLKSHATIPVIDVCSLSTSYAVSTLYESVLGAAEDLVGLKTDAAEEYVANQQIIAAEVEAQKKGQNAVLASTLKQHITTDAAIKNNLDYSPLAQSSFACCTENKAAGLVSGNASLPSARYRLHTVMTTYNNSKTSPNTAYDDTYDAVKEGTVLDASVLLPTANTLEADKLDVAAYTTAVLTNPNIDYDPPDKYLEKPAGKKYQTLRRLKEAKIGLSQIAIADIISRKAPIYPLADWMHSMYDSIGIPYNNEDIKEGMISADALLNMEVESRYANPAYITDIHRKNSTGVLREILVNQSINLEFQRLELRQQEFISALQASRSSTMAQTSLNPVMDREIHNAILQVK